MEEKRVRFVVFFVARADKTAEVLWWNSGKHRVFRCHGMRHLFTNWKSVALNLRGLIEALAKCFFADHNNSIS